MNRAVPFVVALSLQAVPAGSGQEWRSSTESVIVSPAVVATWISHIDQGDRSTLDLLVLWRGTPGWFLKPGPVRESSGGTQDGAHTFRMTRGGVDVELTFNARTRVARVGPETVALGEANVILVDAVNQRPTVAGTRFVEPGLRGSPARIQQVLKRSDALVAYLRCGVRLSDDRVNDLMVRVCALLDEEHLPVGRQRPRLMRDQQLEPIAGFAERGHAGADRVAHVPRMLEHVVAAMFERL